VGVGCFESGRPAIPEAGNSFEFSGLVGFCIRRTSSSRVINPSPGQTKSVCSFPQGFVLEVRRRVPQHEDGDKQPCSLMARQMAPAAGIFWRGSGWLLPIDDHHSQERVDGRHAPGGFFRERDSALASRMPTSNPLVCRNRAMSPARPAFDGGQLRASDW